MIAVVRGSLIVTDAVTVTDEIGEPPASLRSTQRYSSEPVMYIPFPCPFAYGSSPTDIVSLMGFCLVVSEGDEPKKKLPPLMVMLPPEALVPPMPALSASTPGLGTVRVPISVSTAL